MGILKITLGFMIFVILMAVLQTQSVVDMLLIFAAAGVVPGTSLSLSPEATLWSIAGLVMASLLLVLRRPLAGLFSGLGPLAKQTVVALRLYFDRYVAVPWRGLSAKLPAIFTRRVTR
jgi:hypothetical protein